VSDSDVSEDVTYDIRQQVNIRSRGVVATRNGDKEIVDVAGSEGKRCCLLALATGNW